MNTGPGIGEIGAEDFAVFHHKDARALQLDGQLDLCCGRPRRNVTIRLALGPSLNRLYGSDARILRSCSIVARWSERLAELVLHGGLGFLL